MKGRSSPDQALRRAGAMGLRPFCHGAGQRERRQASSIRQQAWAGGASCCTSPSCSGASRPGRLADAAGLVLSSCHRGDVAQLGERGVRNAEVGSSILLVSTTPIPRPTRQKVGRFCLCGWGNYSEIPKSCLRGMSAACMEAIIGLVFTSTCRGRVWCILLLGPGCWRLTRDYCI